MTETQQNFSKFGNSFQKDLIKSVYNNHTFFLQIFDILDESYFSLETSKWFWSFFINFYKKYKIIPSSDELSVAINTDAKDDMKVLLFREISELDKCKSKKFEYINDKALQFCKTQALKKAIYESHELIDKDDSNEKIRKLLNDALNAGQSKNIGHEYLESLSLRTNLEKRNPIPTPWESLNKYFGGGFAQGELILLIAGTGGGKSHMCVDLGAHALQLGFNVVHYTLELSDIATAKRYDSRLTGIDINIIDKHYDKVKDTLEAIRNKGGKLIIKQFNTKSATINTFRSHLSKLTSKEIIPNMIIVDYLDLIKPTNHYDQKRFELESLVEELRALGQEFKSTVISPTQLNRAGANETLPSIEHLSEAFSKAFVADGVIETARPRYGIENNKGNMLIAKNRMGPDGIIFPMTIDTSTSIIKVFDAANEGPQEFEKKVEKENIKTAYKEYKKRQNNESIVENATK